MKLYIELLDTQVVLLDGGITTIVLESAVLYREAVENLKRSVTDDLPDWNLSVGEKIIKKSKDVEVIDSPYSINLQDKRLQKAVIDNLYKIALDEGHYSKTQQLLNQIEAYLYELEWEMDASVQIQEPDLQSLIKLGAVGILAEENLYERLAAYIKTAGRLMKVKCLVLLGFQDWFKEEEWRQLEQLAVYEGLNVICMERRKYFETKHLILFDEDNCRVL